MTRERIADAAWILAGIVPCMAVVLWLIDAEHGLALTSLGSTAVLLFCFPEHEGARPVSVLAAHLLGAAVGIALFQVWGSSVWTMAAGVAAIAVVMRLAGVMHPPAGANPLIVLNLHSDWTFIGYPLLPALLVMLVTVYAWSRIRPGPRWPLRWR